jgi:hypothetical protein
MKYYILDENDRPVPEPDLRKWAAWFCNVHKRRVAIETIDGVQISTIFLGMDHNWENSGPPILWETMVFGGELSDEQDRCSGNREQAEAMHLKMVERVKSLQVK